MVSELKEKSVIFKGDSIKSILSGNKTQIRRVISREDSRFWSNMAPGERCKADEDFWSKLIWDMRDPPVPWKDGLDIRLDWDGDGVWKRMKSTWEPEQLLWVKEAFWASHDMEGREYADPVDYGIRLGEDYYESGHESCVQYCATPENSECPDEPGEFIHEDFENLESPIHWTPWEFYSKQSPIFMPKWASRLWLMVTDVRAERLNDITIEDALAEGVEPDVCNHAWADNMGCTDCMGTGLLSDPRWEFEHTWDQINAKRGFPWKNNPWVWVFTFETVDRPNLWPNRKADEDQESLSAE